MTLIERGPLWSGVLNPRVRVSERGIAHPGKGESPHAQTLYTRSIPAAAGWFHLACVGIRAEPSATVAVYLAEPFAGLVAI